MKGRTWRTDDEPSPSHTVRGMGAVSTGEGGSEEELRSYRRLARAGLEGLLVLRDGRVIDANERMAGMLDRPVDELKGTSPLEFISPGDRRVVKTRLRNPTEAPTTVTLVGSSGGTLEVDLVGRDMRIDGAKVSVMAFRRDTVSRRNERALKESEERFDLAFKMCPYPASIASLKDHRLVAVSDEYVRRSGRTRDELIGRRDPEMRRMFKTAAQREVLRELRSTGSIRDVRVEHTTRDGQTRVGLMSAITFPMEGEPHVLSIVKDVTEEQQSAMALRRSEEKYRLLAENVADVIWTMGLDLRCTYVSPSVKAQRGYEPEEMLGHSLEEYLTPHSYQRSMEMYRRYIDSVRDGTVDPHRHQTLELEVYRKDGSTFWSETTISVLYDDEGDPRGILGLSRDITKRKRAEELLRASREKYRLLADNVADVIWTLDLDLNLTFVSPSLRGLLGITVEEALGRRVVDALTPESLERVQTAVTDVLDPILAGEASPDARKVMELELIRKDGSTVWTETTMTPILDPEGNLMAILGITRDIDTRKEVEKQLIESEERFQALVEATFEAIIIHKDGVIIDANQRAADLSGHSMEELRGMSPLDLISMEDMDRVAEQLVNGGEHPVEAELIGKDGSGTSLEMVAKAIKFRGEDARVIALRDISARRRAGAARRESEERYKTLSDANFEGIFIHRSGVILEANQKVSEMTGYQADELIGMSTVDITVPEDRELVRRRMAGADEEPYEVGWTRKDGSRILVEVSEREIPFRRGRAWLSHAVISRREGSHKGRSRRGTRAPPPGRERG